MSNEIAKFGRAGEIMYGAIGLKTCDKTAAFYIA